MAHVASPMGSPSIRRRQPVAAVLRTGVEGSFREGGKPGSRACLGARAVPRPRRAQAGHEPVPEARKADALLRISLARRSSRSCDRARAPGAGWRVGV